MWLLTVIADVPHPATQFTQAEMPPILQLIMAIIGGVFVIVPILFWIWMLFHCIQTEPDRNFWIWIFFIAGPIGPTAYFLMRYLPSKEFPVPSFFRRWKRSRELVRLEISAQQIGNPHQFILWGNALREVGEVDRADAAFQSALQKEPQNIQALWGAAQIANTKNHYTELEKRTRQILAQDPEYKFGDVSLLLGKALKELGQSAAALSHLQQHVKRWRHPEALFLLAELYLQQNQKEAAAESLHTLIQDINGSPASIARKYGRCKSRAKRLLRKCC